MEADETRFAKLPMLPVYLILILHYNVHVSSGKNRPLDPEELAFMDRLLDEEADRERKKKEYEEQGLEEFRMVSGG